MANLNVRQYKPTKRQLELGVVVGIIYAIGDPSIYTMLGTITGWVILILILATLWNVVLNYLPPH